MEQKKRLINANDMKTAFREWFCNEDYRTMDQLIDDIPTVDAVEVVRCKDCFYNANGCCTRSELYDDTVYRPNYFCADGERKT